MRFVTAHHFAVRNFNLVLGNAVGRSAPILVGEQGEPVFAIGQILCIPSGRFASDSDGLL